MAKVTAETQFLRDLEALFLDCVGDMSPIMRFANLRLETGPSLHYAECGNREGKPVVFLHGWPDSWFTFSRVLSLRAVAVDQRGFGDSDRPESGYTIPEMGADVIAFLDALEIKRATLVGHSFGSFVARQAAIAQPQRVAALVLIGTGFAGVESGHAGPAERLAQPAGSDLGGVRTRFSGEHRISPASG